MKTTKLSLDFDLELIVYGLSSHEKDFRVAWELNQLLNIDLRREKDYMLWHNNEEQSFSNFKYLEEENGLEFRLCSNRSYQGFLIPEYKAFQFIFTIDGAVENFNFAVLENLFYESKFLLTYTEININNLKSKQNLIFE